MNDMIAVIGLVFVVMLFNFTYPQSALELLLKSVDYRSRLKDNKEGQFDVYLRNVKGWFFFTDVLQFLGTYFIGLFALVFGIYRYFPNTPIFNIISLLASSASMTFYIYMLFVAVKRIKRFGEQDDFMNRSEWFHGSGKPPFDRKFPSVSFYAIAILTCLGLCLATVDGLGLLRGPAAEHGTVALGSAMVITLILYLCNFWGLYVYMPGSSTSLLAFAANSSVL